MKKVKKKVKPAKPAASEMKYTVRLYAESPQKWDSNKRTKIHGVENGLLIFSHRKPRSPKQVRRAVPLEQVIQYGGDASEGWVYLRGVRTLIDKFTAIGDPKRVGKFITFDLGDGMTTVVNADADFETSAEED